MTGDGGAVHPGFGRRRPTGYGSVSESRVSW